MGYQPPFKITNEINELCVEVAELVGMVHHDAELMTSPTLHRELRIHTIRSSLMIEGNTLSEDAVTAIMDGKRVLGPAKDIREVENAQRAYDLLPTLDPFSIDDLLRAHKTMMDGLIQDAGCFRSRDVGVFDGESLIHAGTPAAYVSQLMSELFDWLASTDMHALVASCIFHFEFEFIHPFADGNGRTGRLWHTLLLSRWRPVLAWLPVESVIRERQQEYYRAFMRSEAAGSSEVFVTFMLEVIRDALKPYVMPSNRSDQQRRVALKFFSDNPTGTIRQLAELLGCSTRSAERLVARLRREGLLERTGSARKGTWVIKE